MNRPSEGAGAHATQGERTTALARTTRAFIALGANLGDRRTQLERGLDAIRALDGVDVVATSPWFIAPAVGGPPGQPEYLNGVAELRVDRTARWLLERLLEIERAVGRDRANEERNGPRVLDLDLLLFGAVRIDEPDLTVPHPRMETRRFVLAPLATIAPELRLPSGRTVRQALLDLNEPELPVDRAGPFETSRVEETV